MKHVRRDFSLELVIVCLLCRRHGEVCLREDDEG